MKATHFFHIGLVVDSLILILGIAGILSMSSASEGLSPLGKQMLWLFPALLVLIMGAAIALKNAGKLLPANILLWIPALPMLVSILLWGGLALLFVIAGPAS